MTPRVPVASAAAGRLGRMGLQEQEYRKYIRDTAEHLVDLEEEATRVRVRRRLRRAVIRVFGLVFFFILASTLYMLWLRFRA